MIIYNVTVQIEHSKHKEWLQWLKADQIPAMMETMMFLSHRLCRLLGQDETVGPTYAVQYFCNSIDNYNRYVEEHSAAMKKLQADRFGNHYIAFHTLLEVLPLD